MNTKDVIVALATPPGIGAIAVIRVSGEQAITIVAPLFKPVRSMVLAEQLSHTVHLGHFLEGEKVLDKVLLTVFKAPNSYTGENVVEISCHGSLYIQQKVIQVLLNAGCRMAKAGEFTLRAFLNGKMDLSQAEAVADLIASEDQASHTLAIQQMRGGFRDEIEELRQQLLHFASMIELELDFAGEDVEFADRKALDTLLRSINDVLVSLLDSFALGNALKNGIPVAIVGAPNAGKSTLLNAIIKEDRAIVSDIPGTTRDSIEDEITIQGIRLRFIDTAGLRDTEDTIENIGIAKAYEKLKSAAVILYLIDGSEFLNDSSRAADTINLFENLQKEYQEKKLLIVVNKTDSIPPSKRKAFQNIFPSPIFISALKGEGIDILQNTLIAGFNLTEGASGQTVVSNARHFDALRKAQEEISAVREGLNNKVPSDLLAIDIRQALNHLGEITGQITTEDLLGNIFSSFCIGK